MTNLPPKDPESSQTSSLGFDEFIGILVAFATMGVILFWSFSRRGSEWNLPILVLPNSTPLASPTVPPVNRLEADSTNNFNVSPSSNPTSTPVEPTETQTPSFTEEAPPQEILPGFPHVTTQDLPHKSLPFTLFSSTISENLGTVTPSAKMPTIPPPIAFTDVPHEFWASRFINALSSRGIIRGFPDYTFRPLQPLTRAEFAAFLEQAFAKKPGMTGISFKDVPKDFWATSAIDEAISNGFLTGYPNQTFKPEQKITRVQVLVALVAGLNLKATSSPDLVISLYKDADDIPEYAINQVAAATENSLVLNFPDVQTLEPNKEATRAEVAAMVHQALVLRERLNQIQSQYIVRIP
jgi:uncharacterized Zn-finger protein